MDSPIRLHHHRMPQLQSIYECTGKREPTVSDCTCPDLALSLRIRVTSGNTTRRDWLCLCCEGSLPPSRIHIDKTHPQLELLP